MRVRRSRRDQSDQSLTSLWRDFVRTRRRTRTGYWTRGPYETLYRDSFDVLADVPFDEDNIAAARVLTDALLEDNDPERIRIGHELRKFVSWIKKKDYTLQSPRDKDRFAEIRRKFSRHVGTVYNDGSMGLSKRNLMR